MSRRPSTRSGGDESLSLPQVAAELGVTRSAVYLMVRHGRLRAQRDGYRWTVRPRDLESFLGSYQPSPTAGRQFGPRKGEPTGPDRTLELLCDWGEATVTELAEVLDRDEGNVRKYVGLLDARGLAERGADGLWRPLVCPVAFG